MEPIGQDQKEKRILNAQEFIDICSLKYRDHPYYSQFYQGHDQTYTVLEFNNCVIEESVHLVQNRHLIVKIKSCKFESILLSGIKDILSIDVTTSEIGSLLFFSSKFKRISIAKHSLIGTLHFRNTQTETLSLDGMVNVGSLHIDKISEIEKLIFNAIKAHHFNLWNSEIKRFAIDKSQIGRIDLQSSLVKDCVIDTSRIYKIELIRLNSDSRQLFIYNSTIDYFKANTIFEYNVTINDSSVVANLIVNSNGIANRVNYYISDTQINHLDVTSVYNKGDIVFNNVEPINTLHLFEEESEFPKYIDGKFQFKTINEKSSLWIFNSDLGNTQLVGCKFGDFDTFLFQNSKMLNVFIADTTLPHKDKIYTGGEDGDTIHLLEQKRLVLSQFKKIHENRGDIVRANQYLAEEMEIYREQLKHQKIESPSEWFNNKSERANLWLNKFSSYYGNNWLRAAFVTIIINSVLFILYSLSLGYRPGSDSNLFWTLAAYSFEFLNPLRKADFLQHLTQKQPNALSIFIDYVSRIIIAYFVYQTIQAFRKFGKRS